MNDFWAEKAAQVEIAGVNGLDNRSEVVPVYLDGAVQFTNPFPFLFRLPVSISLPANGGAISPPG